MAIKAGQIIHTGNDTVLIDRLQTAGPGDLNIPTEKIYELGNYQSVATIRDVPDLSFNMESFDVSTEVEQLLTGGDPTSGIAMNAAKTVDVVSPFKAGQQAGAPFDVVSSVALPNLIVESLSYRFGLRDNARQTVGLRGDSIFYCPGSAYVQTVAGTGTAGQTIASEHPAYVYRDANGPHRVLSVVAGNKRLSQGADYTEDAVPASGTTTVTITLVKPVPVTDQIRVVYSTPDVRNYPQTVHATTAVKPAAVRGRDIDIYVGGVDVGNKLTGVQSVTLDWRVTLEKDEEFGNYYAVAQDFDVPVVNGNIEIKPTDPADFFAKLRRFTGVAAEEVIGTHLAVPLALDIVIKDAANSGAVLKRLHVDDARFTVPGYQAQVEQKLTVSVPWESDGGNLVVFNN